MNYRADIDGLRAIAVLSVVIFHLGVPGFGGGYVGVDVFFVISGYLITSIIKHKYEQRSFKLSDFYFRRIKRLIPPLIATIAATLVGAAFIMTPYDMTGFSRSAVAALFSLSNFVFYLESGYWDTASEFKPLLHTWSLGVEEQFYIFWPALILGLMGIRRFVPFGVSLALISVFGAALCIWYTGVDQSAAFYLLPFRVFQFAIGALLIPLCTILRVTQQKWPPSTGTFIFWAGMLCIAISVSALGGDVNFPGWAVLLPTIGAALVLLGGAWPGDTHVTVYALMENPVSNWLGKVSYSMYLVHWPLVALFRYQYGHALSPTDQVLLAAATLVATVLLHYGVERRFYQRETNSRDTSSRLSGPSFALRTFLVLGLLALVNVNVWQSDGWPWRFPSLSLSAEQIREGKKRRFDKSNRACHITSPLSYKACNFDAKLQVLVLGNSHEPDGYNFINAGFGNDESINLIMFGGTNPCKDLLRKSGRLITRDELCQERLDALFDPAMAERLDLVFYAANKPYAENKGSILAILRQLKTVNPNMQLITLGGYINTERPCSHYINQSMTTDACALPGNVVYFEDDPSSEPLFNEFRAMESDYIDRVDLLCKNRVLQTCRTRTDDGVPAFYDTHHHSLEFAEMSGKLFAKKHPYILRDREN